MHDYGRFAPSCSPTWIIQRAAGYKEIIEKTATRETRYGSISSVSVTPFNRALVNQGPPNQNVGIASSCEIKVRIETPFSEARSAVLSSKRKTVPVMTPM